MAQEKYPKELPHTITPAGFTALLAQLRTLTELAGERLTEDETIAKIGRFSSEDSTELARFMAGSNSPRLTRN